MAFVMTIPKFAHGNGTVNSLIFRISCLMHDPPRFGGASWLVSPPLWRNGVRILEGKPKVFKTNAIDKKWRALARGKEHQGQTLRLSGSFLRP